MPMPTIAERVYAFQYGFRMGATGTTAHVVGSPEFEAGYTAGVKAIADATQKFRDEISNLPDELAAVEEVA